MRRNSPLAVAPSGSATVTVIMAVPERFAAGVTVTVRFGPLPPNTMFPSGTSAALEEWPVKVRLPAAVSTSAIEKARAGVGVSSSVN